MDTLPTMIAHERQVAPPLSTSVRCLWSMQRDFDRAGGAIDILPDGHQELIFNFGSACVWEYGRRQYALPLCYRVGILPAPIRLRATGHIITLGIRLVGRGDDGVSSWTMPISPLPFAQPLSAIWIELWHRLSAVLHAEGAESALQYLHDQLCSGDYVRLWQNDHQARNQNDNTLEQASTLMRGTFELSMEQVARQISLSRRQLERRFRKEIGLSPKMMNRILRFEYTRDQLCAQPDADLRQLALMSGYADQAHLQREFKHFSHRTPRQFTTVMRSLPAPLRYGVAYETGTRSEIAHMKVDA